MYDVIFMAGAALAACWGKAALKLDGTTLLQRSSDCYRDKQTSQHNAGMLPTDSIR
jgi:hypothetical protein